MFERVSQFETPKIHFWRDELDAVFPAVGPGRTLPHDDGGIAGMVGEIGEGHALLEPQRMLENNHAAIGIHNSRVRFSADPLAPLVVPFETHGNTGVHAASAALFAVFCLNSRRLTDMFPSKKPC